MQAWLTKLDKEDRASLLNDHLTQIGIPMYARAKHLKEIMQATHATVQGWMQGSLPSDFYTGLTFCAKFKLCPFFWGTGEKLLDVNTASDYANIGLKIRAFEKENGVALTDEQYTFIFNSCVNDVANSNKTLEAASIFLKKM